MEEKVFPPYVRKSDAPIEMLIEGITKMCNGEAEWQLTDGEGETRQTLRWLKCEEVDAWSFEALCIHPPGGSRPDFAAHAYVEQTLPGVTIRRGEFDSSGWLSGIINTPLGRLSFG